MVGDTEEDGQSIRDVQPRQPCETRVSRGEKRKTSKERAKGTDPMVAMEVAAAKATDEPREGRVRRKERKAPENERSDKEVESERDNEKEEEEEESETTDRARSFERGLPSGWRRARRKGRYLHLGRRRSTL